MNILLNWHPTCNNAGVKWLIEHFDVDFCAYMYCNEEDRDMEMGIPSEGIYIYEEPDITFAKISEFDPLDKRLLESVTPYESMGLEIAYRWKSSLGLSNDYMEIKDFFRKSIKYWNHYLKNRNIDLVYLADTPHTVTEYAIYVLCKIDNIPIVLSQFLPAVKGEYFVTYFAVGICEFHKGFLADYQDLLAKYNNLHEHEKVLPKYLEALLQTADDTDNVSKTLVVSKRKSSLVSLIFERCKIYIKQKKIKTILMKGLSLLINKERKRRLLKYTSKLEDKAESGEKYVYFPLHLQPEASTVPTSGVFSDMRIVVDIVSKSLPQGVSLYVKEHPGFWLANNVHYNINEVRSKSYYSEILKLGNVKLIDHEMSSIELMKKSEAVITVNGSIGWESIINGKPLIIFGNAFYKYINGVNTAVDLSECKENVEKILSGDISPVSSREIKTFLLALKEFAVPASADPASVLVDGCKALEIDENHLCLAQGLARFIKKVYPETILIK